MSVISFIYGIFDPCEYVVKEDEVEKAGWDSLPLPPTMPGSSE